MNEVRRIKGREPGKVTAQQALSIWQAAHHRESLDDEDRKRLLEDENLLRILQYPRFQVEDALRQHKGLAAALKHLQARASTRPMSAHQKKTTAANRLRNPTRTERILWERLINRKLDGYLFEREYEIDGWYVDFFCAEARLIVEVDGLSHRSRRSADSVRDQVMRANGYTIYRASTHDVEHNLETVVAKIRHHLPSRPSQKAKRQGKTSQVMPKKAETSQRNPRKARPHDFSDQTVSSSSKANQRSHNVAQTIVSKGPVHCAGCVSDFIGTFRSDTGLVKCRKCGNTPIALCRKCRDQIFGDEGTFQCKLCDPTIREIANEAAGPGAQHPTGNLRQARRGKRLN